MKVWIAVEVMSGETIGPAGVFSTAEAAEKFKRTFDAESPHDGWVVSIDCWEIDGQRSESS